MAVDIYRPDQWHDFFVLVGTGAAALTGLVFVAMSLNLDGIVKDPTHRYRALNTLLGLTAVFMRCALVLMGGQNHQAVGVELLTIALLTATVFIGGYAKGMISGNSIPRSSHYRIIAGTSFYLAEIVGSIILISGSISGLYVAAIAMAANLSFMISGAWLLLVGVSRDEAKSQNK